MEHSLNSNTPLYLRVLEDNLTFIHSAPSSLIHHHLKMHFLDLPLEIRDMIWGLVVVVPNAVKFKRKTKMFEPRWLK